jgi:malonyl CoA-acyl carrier protein transacylase/phosphopantetheinyl transferase
MRTRTQLLILQADDPAELDTQVAALASECAGRPCRPLSEVVADVTAIEVTGTHRLAVVASSVPDLERQLARSATGASRRQPHGRSTGAAASATYRGEGPVGDHGRIAWLSPGEGGQYAGMLADLCIHFPQARACFDVLDRALDGAPPSRAIFPTNAPRGIDADGDGPLWQMGGAVEAVFTANRAVSSVLHGLGLEPDVVVGHSTGEYSALVEAGAIEVRDDDALVGHLRLGNRISRELDEVGAIPEGALLTVGLADQETIEAVLQRHRGQAWLALDNCPSQTVVFATPAIASLVTEELRASGALVQPLPFARAYHTPLFASVADALQPLLAQLPMRTPVREVWSSATGSPYPDDPEEIRRVLSEQWMSTVRFRQTVLALHHAGVRIFVEVGPRGNLRQFVADTLSGRPHLAVAADHHCVRGMTQLQHLAAALVAAGVALDPRLLTPRASRSPARQPPPLTLGLPQMHLAGGAPQSDAPVEVRVPAPQHALVPAAGVSARQRVVTEYLRGMDGVLSAEQRLVTTSLNTVGARGRDRIPLRRPVPASRVVSPRTPPTPRGWTTVVVLDPNQDRWLRDHALGATVSALDPDLSALVVVPFTVSLELLARAVAGSAPGRRVTALRDVRAFRWLVVEDGPLAVSLTATPGPGPDDVRVSLEERDHPDAGPVIEGVVELGGKATPPTTRPWTLRDGGPPAWQPDELYRYGMFHGPTFRGVRSVDAVGSEGLLATIEISSELPGPVPLTSPLHTDSCGQLLGFWTAARLVRGFAVFPHGVERLDLPGAPLPTRQPLRARLRVRSVAEASIQADIEVHDAQERRLLQVTGWSDTRVRLPAALLRLRVDPARTLLSEDWVVPVAGVEQPLTCRRLRLDERMLREDGGIWLDVLASLVLSRSERSVWRGIRTTRRAMSWLAGRVAAKDVVRCAPDGPGRVTLPADLPVEIDDLGAPRIGSADSHSPAISISHTGGWGVAVAAGHGRVGIDIELLHQAPVGLGDMVVAPEEAEAAGLGAISAERALRLWCAKEAAAKALGHGMPAGPASILVTASDPDATTLELAPGPTLLATDARTHGARIRVHTTRDDDVIAAIAER